MIEKVSLISSAGCSPLGRGPQTSLLRAVKSVLFMSCSVFPSKREGMGLMKFPQCSGVKQLLHPAAASMPS